MMRNVIMIGMVALLGSAAFLGGAAAGVASLKGEAASLPGIGREIAEARAQALEAGLEVATIADLLASGHLSDAPRTPGRVIDAGAAWQISPDGKFAHVALVHGKGGVICETLEEAGGGMVMMLNFFPDWDAHMPAEMPFGCNIEGGETLQFVFRL
jgi:hypothetical protein